jgi:hypothetical protein
MPRRASVVLLRTVFTLVLCRSSGGTSSCPARWNDRGSQALHNEELFNQGPTEEELLLPDTNLLQASAHMRTYDHGMGAATVDANGAVVAEQETQPLSPGTPSFWEGLWRGDDVLDGLFSERRATPLSPSLIEFTFRGNHSASYDFGVNRDHLPDAELKRLLEDAGDGPRVQLLGMMASGTNLMMSLISRNLRARVLDKLDLGFGLFWKHSPVQQTLKGRSHQKAHFQKVNGLAIVRNPLALVARYVGQGAWKNMCGRHWERLTSPELGQHCGPAATVAPDWDGGARYVVEAASIGALWNDYAASYLNELSGLGFNHTLVLRYEDLLEEPEAALKQVAEFLGLQQPSKVEFPERPQGPSSHGTSRTQALDEYLTQAHLNAYSPEAKRAACTSLDRKLMRELRYFDCEPK